VVQSARQQRLLLAKAGVVILDFHHVFEEGELLFGLCPLCLGRLLLQQVELCRIGLLSGLAGKQL
jgi:hypothetical protein